MNCAYMFRKSGNGRGQSLIVHICTRHFREHKKSEKKSGHPCLSNERSLDTHVCCGPACCNRWESAFFAARHGCLSFFVGWYSPATHPGELVARILPGKSRAGLQRPFPPDPLTQRNEVHIDLHCHPEGQFGKSYWRVGHDVGLSGTGLVYPCQ